MALCSPRRPAVEVAADRVICVTLRALRCRDIVTVARGLLGGVTQKVFGSPGLPPGELITIWPPSMKGVVTV